MSAKIPSYRFDLLFMDPPYNSDLAEKTIVKASESDILVSDGLVIVEHSSKLRLDDKYGGLVHRETRRFGDTALSFFIFQPQQ